MRKTISIIVFASIFAVSVVASSFQQKYVSSDAKWIIHTDLERNCNMVELDIPGPKRAEKLEGSLTYDGIRRTYRLYIPTSHDKTKPSPLLMVLHGGGGTGKRMENLTRGGFKSIADKEGFVIVYPDGIEKHWNDGRTEVTYRTHKEKIDDVGFLTALMDHLIKEFNLDSERVYVSGASNGAMMSHRLAFEASAKVAAIAPVIGSIPVALGTKISPTRPVPVLIMNGTKDKLVPWQGGNIRFGWRKLGKVFSVRKTVEFWVKHNGCSTEPVKNVLLDYNPKDGTRVMIETYSGGKEGSEVVLYKIEGGGHTWPWGMQYLPEIFIGKTSRDINACEIIWQFFKQHIRKPK